MKNLDWKELELVEHKPSMFRWFINYNCNYSCSYCYQRDFRKKYNFQQTIEEQYETAKKIKEYIEKESFEKLSIQGGEPTTIKLNDMVKILSVFRNSNIKVLQIISNFSADLNYYLTISRLLSSLNLRYMFSFHSDHIDMEEHFKKLDDFLTNLEKNNLYKTRITLQYTITKDTKKDALKFTKKYEELKSKHQNSGLELQLGIYSEYDINCKPIYIYDVREDGIPKELEKYLIYDVDTKITDSNNNTYNKRLSFFELFKAQNVNHLICSQKRVHLERNELTSYCCNFILTKDFLHTKLEDIKEIPNECDCNFKVCSGYFLKARK